MAVAGLGRLRLARIGPAEAVAAYGAALGRGDLRSAYAKLSASYRRRVSFEQYRREVAGSERDAGAALQASAERWRDRAELRLGNGEPAALVREAGGWRLDAPPLLPFEQSTPQAALRAFVHALELERWDRLVDLAPARYRSEVTPQKLRRYWQGQPPERRRALVAALRLALERPVIEEGDEAHVVYRPDRRLTMVKEEGLWRVENPE